MTELTALQNQKSEIRTAAHSARNAQENKDELSKQIVRRFMDLDEYARSETVLFYVDVRSEVRTRHSLVDALASRKRIVVPYCVEGDLHLFWLKDISELTQGAYRILEPDAALRNDKARWVDPDQLDMVMVPGVAFDRRGARMGHGFGYYDKMLEHVRDDACMAALAFECQIFPEIPMQPHDVFMDYVITELGVIPGLGRGAA